MKRAFVLLILGLVLVLNVAAIGSVSAQRPDLKTPPDIRILDVGDQPGLLRVVGDVLFTALLFVAAIFFVVGGYIFVTAVGDPEKHKKARTIILYGIIGLIVAFAARALVELVNLVAGSQSNIVNNPTP